MDIVDYRLWKIIYSKVVTMDSYNKPIVDYVYHNCNNKVTLLNCGAGRIVTAQIRAKQTYLY